MLEACGYETLNIVQLINQIPSPARWGYAFETAASARYTPSQMCHLSWVVDEKVLPPAVRGFGAFLSIHTDLLQLPLPLRFQHLDTSTAFLLFCWKTAAEKHGKTETIDSSRSIESRDVVDEDRLGRRHDKAIKCASFVRWYDDRCRNIRVLSYWFWTQIHGIRIL